nr:cytochrome c [Nannocystis pusilla]
MFWLEGTAPIGWEGDAFDLFSYLYGSPGPTIGLIVDTASHQAFYDYLAGLIPPPPANGVTERDGSLTEAGRRGEALFRGAANCASCHAGPLTTGGLRLPGGGTESDHPIVVPSLVGAYRHGHWLVNGAAWTLAEAVDAMLPLSGATLTDAEKTDLVRYLGELTAREFFVLASVPAAGANGVGSEGPLRLTLSHPVFDDPDNLAKIGLRREVGPRCRRRSRSTAATSRSRPTRRSNTAPPTSSWSRPASRRSTSAASPTTRRSASPSRRPPGCGSRATTWSRSITPTSTWSKSAMTRTSSSRSRWR